MDSLKHQKLEEDQPYDGAIQQITPAPEHFVPQGMLDFERKDEIKVVSKPHRRRGLAALLYFGLQGTVLFGLLLNYDLFSGFSNLVLWSLTIVTFVAYFRVSFSNPGYYDGNVIILEDYENELNEYDIKAAKEEKPKDKKKTVKTSVLTKGFVKHSRMVKSNQGLAEASRHIRTNSLGSTIMTQTNQYNSNKGYARLSDHTLKSGDFSKIRTEMEDLDFSETNHFTGKSHHRRKASLIKKIGAIHASNLSELDSQSDINQEKSKAFNLIADRIANSKATVETEQVAPSTPPGHDTNGTFHRRTNSNEDDDKGVFKSFKDGDEHTENKQIPLASNAITSDTDNLASNTQGGVKRILDEPKDFEAIKEVDENNESFDARKHFDEIYDSKPPVPEVNFHKRIVSDGDYAIDFKRQHYGNKLQETDSADDEKNEDTCEEDLEANDIHMISVDNRFCISCNAEQPLRTKHCKSCRKCVSTYDHHCPWVGN